MEESADTHADSMRSGKAGLADYVEAVHENRFANRRNLGRAAVMAGVGGAGLYVANRASAADNDVAILQTAASLENLAVATYTAALGLDFVKTGNATVLAFAQMTKAQHADHAQAFNAAAKNAGGAAQTNPDPKYLKVVTAAEPGLTSYTAVVKLATTLEDIAAQTYTANASLVSTATLRSLFVSVAGVEAQHKAILLAVGALLANNLADEIKLGPDLTKLPAAAGKVGFPDAFYPITSASPASEGAVQ
jgi:hypothetical protein